MEPPFLKEISRHHNILLAGAGGGFDIFSGIPLFEYLKSKGKQVHLASLSFSSLKNPRGERLRSDYLKVLPDTPGESWYFPERYLSEWYSLQGQSVPVYSFHGSGARTVLNIYRELQKLLGFEALVLVDGGSDSLMRGDEPGLGSPAEDMASIAAAHMLEGAESYLLTLGFGIDYYHEVCHSYVLEAVADLTKTGDFLGAFSLLPGMPEFEAFASALEFTHQKMPGRQSIVGSSILAAGRGEFGNYHSTDRTEGAELFINPLMALYWGFRLEGIAKRCLYLDYIKDTHSRMDVHRAISNFLHTVTPRPWLNFPH